MCSHVPNKGEQMVRYYGYYSHVARGKRKNADADDKIPCILESELTDMAFRKNWARLIQKIYEVDPLKCPKCQGCMRVIAFIEHEDVIKKILPRRTSPQAFGLVGGESEAVTASQHAALYFGFISNSFCG